MGRRRGLDGHADVWRQLALAPQLRPVDPRGAARDVVSMRDLAGTFPPLLSFFFFSSLTPSLAWVVLLHLTVRA